MNIPRIVIVGGKLALICTVAAVVLALVNAVTAPVIVANREKALAEGLADIADRSGIAGASVSAAAPAPDSDVVESAFAVVGQGGTPEGYILQLAGVGYGGDIHLLAGYRISGELFAARVMQNQETPGLGKKAEAPGYMDKFLGAGGERSIPVSKSDLPAEQADAITGATITFLGIGSALEQGSDFVKSAGRRLSGGAQ